MSILRTILERTAMSLLNILLYPAIKEEREHVARIKSRIERINVDRRKRGEPELIVIGDTYPPHVIVSE